MKVAYESKIGCLVGGNIVVQAVIGDDHGLGSAFERHDDILLEMGRAVAIWGALSHLLRSLVERILDCEPRQAEVLLNGFPGEDKRIRFVIDLMDTRDQSQERDEIIAVLGRLKKLAEERNLIVHGAPVTGGRQGGRPRSEYFLNMRKEAEEDRYVDARELLRKHITRLRRNGGQLFDLLYPAPP